MSNLFEILPDRFSIRGEKQPLLCGEVHYFRIPRQYWEAVLDRLIESGCNAVAYYVPWFVHEYEEGKFDFTGKVHPDNDLQAWIRLTEEKGLLAFLRPGPYIYAETSGLGIPAWFIEKHPNTKVKEYRDGEYREFSKVNGVGHNHPDFLAAVSRWYTAVAQEVREHLAPKGNIVMVQLCNEIPGDDYDDRNPENLGIGNPDGIYPSYLRNKYGTAEALSQAYGTVLPSLEKVEPHMLEQANPALAQRERLSFYYDWYYPTYFRRLQQLLTGNGIDSYFVHNAYNPRAISLHVQNRRQNPWLTVGVDCYYSLSGRLGIRDATYYCEYGPEYIRRFLKNVPWVIEQECGYWNDFPEVYGPELYIWNIWTVAGGYRGFNMYLFAAGINRPGMGFHGTDHNWQAPVGYDGEKQESFEEIRRSLADIRANWDVFSSELRYDIALGVKSEPGLIWKKVAKPSNEAYFALKTAGFTPRLCDFEEEPLEELCQHPALFVVSDEVMEPSVQEKLLAYARQGGTLILNGLVPWQDRQGRPCEELAKGAGLSIKPSVIEEIDSEKMTLEGVEYHIGTRIQDIEASHGEILAQGEKGTLAAVRIPIGEGTILVLPFTFALSFRATAEGLRRLLKKVEVTPLIAGAQKLRIIPKEDGRCIALNLAPVPVKETITIAGKESCLVLEPHSFIIF